MKKQQGYIDGVTIFYSFVLLIIAVFIGMAIWFSIYRSTNHHNVTFTVNKSERICESGKSGSCRYLVYTDNGVYQNTDSLWNGKWNSSDLYNQIQQGKKYSCDVVGFRNGFWSWYENLIKCNEVK